MTEREGNQDRRLTMRVEREKEGERLAVGEDESRREREKCHYLFSSSVPVTADMIPFPGFQGDQVVSCLLQGLGRGQGVLIRSKIREEVRRWHPDKFLQKLGCRVAEVEREEVMGRVKAVAQALNDYGKPHWM